MNKKWIVYVVAFAAFFGPFTQTIYAPLIPEVQRQFHTSEFVINLTISIFTLVLALMQIVYGPLADRLGRRKIMLPGILIYIGASIGAALSPSIPVLIFFRALQAAGIAVGSVVATTVIGDLFTGKQLGRSMGTFQMMVSLGPVVGPVIGGIVGEISGFHGVFWVLAATGVIMWLLTYKFLPETKTADSGGSRISIRDFYLILKHPVGSSVILLGFVQYFTFYNFLVFMPHLLSEFYHLSASEKGIIFLPMSLGVVIGSFAGSRLQEHFNSKKFLIFSSSLNVIATLLFVMMSSVSLTMLIVSISLFGLCLGLSLPVQTTLLSLAFLHNRATAIGTYNFFRYLGMAAGPMIGAIFYNLGNRIEFIFAAFVFTLVVLFAARQFVRTRQNLTT
ncbi:MFS transporter [Pseudobacillus wudalianchiensis]|uniref:MFS transporter n=1 Tax=Pseudobacillus wudalianchiensis TaxID=1743143 RepID=A0A1B9ATM7_9BACI|nr:MFS transporter [Bacillus wudalianchiensis]OCA87227.1 MFS transporter [Bacillus wudalianchiensis]